MAWPHDDLITYPNFSDKEWARVVTRGNPDRHHPPEVRHQADVTGRGPDDGWAHEQVENDVPNFRGMVVNIPYGFPRINADNLFAPGITAQILGMAAPSPATDRELVDNDFINGMVSLIGERKAEPAGTAHLPYKSVQWGDFTGNDQALDLALQFARGYIEAESAEGEIPLTPSVLFHCAWGLGRTGTALASYQLVNDAMSNRDNEEAQRYFSEPRIKTSLITVHGDFEKGEPQTKKVATTPAVALAINKIRRLTDPPMVAVETEAQILALENMESRIAQAMCERLARPYPGAAVVVSTKRFIDTRSDESSSDDVSTASLNSSEMSELEAAMYLLAQELEDGEASSAPAPPPRLVAPPQPVPHRQVPPRQPVPTAPIVDRAAAQIIPARPEPQTVPAPPATQIPTRPDQRVVPQQPQRPMVAAPVTVQRRAAQQPITAPEPRPAAQRTGNNVPERRHRKRDTIIGLVRAGVNLLHPQAIVAKFTGRHDNVLRVDEGPDRPDRRPPQPRRR